MPIPFTCPHCGAFTEVAESYAGRTGPCATCGKPITVPTAATLASAAGPRRVVWTRRVGGALGMLAILAAGVFLFLLLFVAAFQPRAIPWIGPMLGLKLPPPPQCENNLERIGAAMQAYLEDKGHYPPAYTVDGQGKPLHSWRVLLLPYLGEQRLYEQINLSEPWNSPMNLAAGRRLPDVYRCPADWQAARDETSYVVIVGPTLLFSGPQGRRPDEVSDPTGQTLLVVEVAGAGVHWMEPRDLDVASMDWRINAGPTSPGSGHDTAGLHVLMADGRVYHLGEYLPPEEFQAMATIGGGESVDPAEWTE